MKTKAVHHVIMALDASGWVVIVLFSIMVVFVVYKLARWSWGLFRHWWNRDKPAESEPQPLFHVTVAASTAKLLLTALGLAAALAVNHAVQQSFQTMSKDIPWIASGGPWLYAAFVIIVVIMGSMGLSQYLRNLQTRYPNETFVPWS